jgi:hypothetical protein
MDYSFLSWIAGQSHAVVNVFESEATFMTLPVRSRMSVILWLVAFVTVIGGLMAALMLRGAIPAIHAAQADSTHMHIDCVTTKMCADVSESDEGFGPNGAYIGHDEPSNLFYSDTPGSGNQMKWHLRLPTDPPTTTLGMPTSPGESFNFQLHPAFWFGMAMCDEQSDPNPGRVACTPDSNSNIFNSADPNSPGFIGKHPGTAFMEMQFYPPGWVEWPAAIVAGGTSCNPTMWCAALNIDSLSRDPINGTVLNPTCLAKTGEEYVNFAFITTNGVSQAPANPVESTVATFTPDPNKDLFMNSGDDLAVTMQDTTSGLRIDIQDQTTGGHGFMVASAANQFGEVKFAPSPSTECTNIPTNFHPMYSTSSPDTRVPWAAHSYNIAFSDEIGHFDYCNGPKPVPTSEFGVDLTTGSPISCPNGDFEGVSGDKEPSENLKTGGDDNFCFPASRSSLVPVSGCTDSNFGFDGVPYKLLWPDGNTSLHPTSLLFSSPLTGKRFDENYTQNAFETDLPDLEASCTILSANDPGCTLIPTTDDSRPADFYPYYSIPTSGSCMWQIGGAIPNSNLFNQNKQYGLLLPQLHLRFGGGGATHVLYPDFQGVITNPCPAGS